MDIDKKQMSTKIIVSMKWITIIAILVLFLTPLTEAFAWQNEERVPVTPYGDFCRRCSHYGVCRDTMSPGDSRKAMIDYYHNKGLDVEIENIRGRFIKAKIKDKGEIVDIIIFDRRTGRIRSIY